MSISGATRGQPASHTVCTGNFVTFPAATQSRLNVPRENEVYARIETQSYTNIACDTVQYLQTGTLK